MMYKATKLFILFFILFGCITEPHDVPEFPVGIVEGYAPVYTTNDEQKIIKFLSPQSLENPGKIYKVDNYLLINEAFKGVHVIDNTDPAHPIPVGFLQIAGNVDVAVKGHILYADHLTDLVAIDVLHWNDIKVISRVPQNYWNKIVPPAEGRYFECVDPGRGVVIGWTLTTLNNPTCFR